jgi:hypothetical protein
MFFERLAWKEGEGETPRMELRFRFQTEEKGKKKIKKTFYFVLTKTSSTFAVPQETGSKSAMLADTTQD